MLPLSVKGENAAHGLGDHVLVLGEPPLIFSGLEG